MVKLKGTDSATRKTFEQNTTKQVSLLKFIAVLVWDYSLLLRKWKGGQGVN